VAGTSIRLRILKVSGVFFFRLGAPVAGTSIRLRILKDEVARFLALH
jgi:hypothetical protein